MCVEPMNGGVLSCIKLAKFFIDDAFSNTANCVYEA